MQDYSKESAGSVIDDAAETFGLGDVMGQIDASCQGSQDGQQEEEVENEDPTLELEAGTELTLPSSATTIQPPDGGRGWGITVAAFFIFTAIYAHTVNLEQVLKDLPSATSQNEPVESCPQTAEYLSRNYLNATFPSCMLYSHFEDIVNMLFSDIQAQCLPESIMSDLRGGMSAEGIAASDITKCDLEIKQHNEMCCVSEVTTVTVPPTTSTSLDFSPIADAYNSLYGLFGIISAIFILIFGYRVVAVVGGLVTAIGCLSASFSSNNTVHLLAFLYGAVPGIGYNFLSVSCTVALLEYFNNRRLTALLLAQLGPILGAMFYPIIQTILFPILSLNVWRNLIRFEAVSAVLVAMIGASLKPLMVRMKDNPNDSLVSRMFGISGLGLFKNPLFYVMAALFFFWKGADIIPYAKLATFTGSILIIPVGMFLVILVYVGSFFGTLFGCYFPRGIKLQTVFIIIIALSAVTGALNMSASQLYDPIFAIVYSGLFGIFTGIGIPCLQYTIPIAFGEENIVLGTGILEFSFGLATIAVMPLADIVHSSMGKVDASLYLSGSMFFVSSVLAGLSIGIHRRQNKVDSTSQEEANQNGKQVSETTTQANLEPGFCVLLTGVSLKGAKCVQEDDHRILDEF
ncbi:uncharacterized protein LOC121369718 [Gigantopelta aegis]|uniref:uncharacterized protein LOC121369718 n=1 Tax=Gigantopelta aegis TaxID=1735272 RepID=UPI001B88C14E|nr:uncharacterized protein LOC121369718 [Gigantopelta aegis]